MIPRPLDVISEADILHLCRGMAEERRTLEFKRDLPGGKNDDLREFPADVTSLANAQGGDLVFGIEDANAWQRPCPPPVSYVKVSGGLFKDMAIHDIDMARWILGEEPSEVFAWGSCLVDPSSDRRAAELPVWLHRYNWHCPRGGKKSKTPISRLGLDQNNLMRLHT